RGAREHNLRDLSLEIPRNALSVVTGVSGSGKSTLAFDILFAEGQRRFMECMSAYARQFVEQLPRPELDALTGLPPTVAIEQRVSRGSAKSTVATVTEVAQYLRLLYARAGTAHNPRTGNALASATPEALAVRMAERCRREKRRRLLICAPLVRDRKGHHQPVANWAKKHGIETLRVDGFLVPVAKFKPLDRYKNHDIEAVLGDAGDDDAGSAEEATALARLRRALELGAGTALLVEARTGASVEWLSTRRADPVTGESFPELEPKNFSWNSPRGWCPECHGHGRVVEKFATAGDDERLNEDASADTLADAVCPACAGARLNPFARAVTLPLAGGNSISLPALLALTPAEVLGVLGNLALDRRGKAIAAAIVPEIATRLRFLDRVGLGYLALDRGADTLSGGEAQRIRLAAQLGSNLAGALYVLDEPSIGLHPRDNQRLITALRELRDRGNTVLVVEHDIETLRAADRVFDLGPGAGVHGGELLVAGTVPQLQRDKRSLTARYLANPMHHPLRGAWRDVPALPATTKAAKASPAAAKTAGSTGTAAGGFLTLRGAALRNLKHLTAPFALGRLNVVCGVSGSGKSTLIRDLLAPAATAAVRAGRDRLGSRQLAAAATGALTGNVPAATLAGGVLAEITGTGAFRQVILVDQDPIGKTPRSTPATYIGAFDRIRRHFAALTEARARGLDAGFFSFNTAGGRCETCAGAGRVKVEMSFLPDTYVPCDACGGSRYGAAAGEVRWRGKTIGDVLAMTFEEAAEFFAFDKPLAALLDLMVETGLGYLALGQSSPTLSGGEAQRLKLVSELAKGLSTLESRVQSRESGVQNRKSKIQNLYLLEEPTIGLHQSDCERLLRLLHGLVDQGHTVVVIEHHTDVIAEADWVLELGPAGGTAGGELLFAGTVRDLATADT
ncbi:MAG: excinuclease ABC subunit UvrA, partial [Puniceicoccales bacterium]|nr:excinuclease ABC subunit UvrA [Puniceicoccales bacterium]